MSCHKSDVSNYPGFKSCLVRIPGTHNYKCVQRKNGVPDSHTEVKIIQSWDGIRPKINPMLYKYYLSLADAKIKSINSVRTKGNRQKQFTSNSWAWIEDLLHEPLADFRKFVSHYIFSRYLVNVKQLSQEDVYSLVMDWLTRCNEIEPLSPSLKEFRNRVKYDIKEATRTLKLPIGQQLLGDMNKGLHRLLFNSRF